MKIVLFRVMTGTKVAEFDTEDDARTAMREYNTMYGYVGVTKLHWENGIEMESTRKGIAPYGITEFNRWKSKFNPEKQTFVIENDSEIEYD